MNDWLRSVTVLGLAFGIVVFVTLELAILIVPGPDAESAGSDPTPPDAAATAEVPASIGAMPTDVGGSVTVSGDRQGIFTLDRDTIEGRYGLLGDDGRIFFASDPLSVAQMEFDGLSFFPDPEECTITAGALNQAIGVAWAHVQCTDLSDIRGNGVISLDGTIGLPGDLLGMRGDLPPTGGTVDAGGEILEFTDAVLFIGARPAVVGGPYPLQLVDEDNKTVLGFDYDPMTYRLSLASVQRLGSRTDVPADACDVSTREVGALSPRVALIELTLVCSGVELADRGPVDLSGSVFVEQIEPPS